MSGSANRWVLRLSTEGADQVIRDLRAAATESAAAGRAYDALIKAQPQLATRAERAEQALRKNIDAMRGMRGELNLLGAATQGVVSSMGSLGSALTSPAAAITALGAASAAGVVQIARIGDEYTNTMNKLRAATGSVQAASAVYAELVAMSQQTGASISESAGAFVRFSVAARAIGATNGEVLQLTRTIQQAGLISGASTQEAAAGVQQLGQALASGTLQGDELRSILENMPTLAEALAQQLGVSVGQLRTMGSEGQLTSDRVFQALLRASEAINKQFNELTPTMGRAFGVLGQAMVEFVGKLDQALGLSQAIARAATTAAAAVGRVSGGIGPRSPAEQAEFDVVQAQARVARLEAELASLSGEPGLYAAPRRGTISRGLQETAAQTQPREERLAELRQRIEAENAIIREGLARRNQAHTEADEIRQAEEATAAARRAAAARTTQTTAFNEARDALDQERKLRADHATRITAIDAGLANGDTDAAGAARLRRMANDELADGLKALDAAARGRIETDESLAEVMRAVADIEKDRQALMREGETVTASVRTEAEKYAEQLAHLNNLLGAGAISQETYNRAVAAADPAIKAAEEASKRIEQENTRTTDRITSFFGDAFARAFEGTGNGFRGLMDSFRRAAISTFASIAAQAVIRPIVAPIVQGLGLSQLGIGGGGSLNLSGLFGSGAAQAATPAGGSGGGGLGSAGSFSTLRTAYDGLTSPGGLGSFFPGGAAVNTGWGGLDGLLNTSLYTPAAAGSLTSSGFYAGTSMAGEAGAFVGGGGAAQSLTLAGSIGPLAAIGGGAYGVYSGIQRGGIGGYTSAAGGAISAATGIGMLGAAAGLLPALGVLGPIGLGVGALLAIGGSLLPGQRASGQGQLARQNLNSSEMSYEGLGGRRFSQGNRDAATGSVQNIAQLAREIGDSLGGARIGGNVAVGVTNGTLYLDVHGRKSQFANNEDGAKQLSEAAARMVIQEFKSQQVVQNDDYRSILNRSDDSLESLGGNLQWYEKIYKALTQSSSAASAYAKAIEEATKPYNDAIGRAQSLGLAEAELVRKRDEAWTRITRARDIETSNLSVGIVSRGIAADAWGGDQGSMKYWQDMQAAANAAETEVTALRLKLEQLGASSEFAATMIAQLETVQRAESAARERARSTAIWDAAIEVNRRAGAAGIFGDAGAWNQHHSAVQTQRGIDAQVTALRKQFEDLGWEAASATVYVERFAQTLWKEYSDREQQRSTKIWDTAIEVNRRAGSAGLFGDPGGQNQYYYAVQTQRGIDAQVLALSKQFEELGWAASEAGLYVERFRQALQAEVAEADRARSTKIWDLAIEASRRVAATGAWGDAGAYNLHYAQIQTQRSIEAQLLALKKEFEQLGWSAADSALYIERFGQALQVEANQREAERIRSLYDIAYSNNMRAAEAGALPGGRGENIRWNTVNLADRAASREVDALRKSLEELGLDAYQTSVHVERLRVTQQAEANQREADRLSQISQYDRSIQSRLLRANGQTEAAGLLEFDAAAAREIQNARKALEELGLGLAEVARRIVETETVLASERVALVKQFAEAAQSQIRQAGQSIRAYIDAQRANSGPGGVSATEAFAAAQGQFGSDLTLARAGDQDALARITTTADRLLEAGQKQFASGIDFQAVRGFVLASLESLPATRSYDSLILEELKKLGGAVQVEVDVTMIRSITEELNALPEAERNRLIQSGEVQRRILQAVAETTGLPLVTPAVVSRTVTQAIETTETVQISRSIDDRLSGILNAQLVIGREQITVLGRMMTDINHIWRYVLGEGGGVTVQARGWAHANTSSIVKFAQGGVFDGPVLFPMRGGTGMLGEAGPEAIMPLDRGPDGRLGVRASMQRLDVSGLMTAVQALRREVAMLRAERAADARQIIQAGERTADAAKDTAASNATMARRDAIVGRRPRAA